jgi:hypothetical protein
MTVFIGAIKKGAYEIGGDTMPYIEFIEGASPNSGYNTYATFAQAKRELLKKLTRNLREYKQDISYAIKYVKSMKEPYR